jgi:metal transporter CNNM
MSSAWTWVAIAACLTQSAIFSGLNLAVFSLSRLRLEAAAEAGESDAIKVLALRRDGHLILVTILWGNVAVNVVITLLAESILTGVAAFLFSTVAITLLCEITPQAWFSRRAMRVASLFSPLLRIYQLLLFPVAWPTAKVLDSLLGPEAIPWFRENELREVLRHHSTHGATEVGQVEATGAINFLALDDLAVGDEGEHLDPESVIALPFEGNLPQFPTFERSPGDPLLRRIEKSGRKWVVIVDDRGSPRCVINAHEFLREAIFGGDSFRVASHCLRPLIVRELNRPLGAVLGSLTVQPERPEDDVVDKDLILVWTDTERRIITGSDLLGRLLRGISRVDRPGDETKRAPDRQ